MELFLINLTKLLYIYTLIYTETRILHPGLFQAWCPHLRKDTTWEDSEKGNLVDYMIFNGYPVREQLHHFTGGLLQQPDIWSSSLSNIPRSIHIERGCMSHLQSRTVRPCDWPNMRQIALATHVPTNTFQMWFVGIQRSPWFRPILHHRLLHQEGHDIKQIHSTNISILVWQPDRAGHKNSVRRAFARCCWSKGLELTAKYSQACRVCQKLLRANSRRIYLNWLTTGKVRKSSTKVVLTALYKLIS